MSLVTMVPTSEVSMCPLRSNMHPSRMTIILIQLVLLKKNNTRRASVNTYLAKEG